MTVRLLFLLPLFLVIDSVWYNNLREAEQAAQREHKYILLNFSGSDWCGPCIRMEKEFFESEVFRQMADTELVLVNIDFPRKKKNQPSPEQQNINDELAEKYNPKGKFPYTLLLNDTGKILQTWEGLPEETADAFTIDIRNGIYTVR